MSRKVPENPKMSETIPKCPGSIHARGNETISAELLWMPVAVKPVLQFTKTNACAEVKDVGLTFYIAVCMVRETSWQVELTEPDAFQC